MRTSKQTAQALAYRDRQGSYASSAVPSTSWWVGLNSREIFDAAVVREAERMNAPKATKDYARGHTMEMRASPPVPHRDDGDW